MKFKVLPKIIMLTKLSMKGVLVQCLLINMIYASDISAQSIKSVKESFVTLDLKNATLFDLFKSIEGQTPYIFTFSKEDIDKNFRITKKGSKLNIGNLLLEVSKETDLTFKQVNLNISVSRINNNMDRNNRELEIIIQTSIVRGRVIASENSDPLPGVNVIEKGTSNGTVTDMDGVYSLSVQDGATLVFSYIGYTKEEIRVEGRSVIDVSLVPDIKSLEEIVVVGYGTQSKAVVTGSIVSTSGNEILKSQNPNVVNAMTGHLAGVVINNRTGEPGRDTPDIFIRGRSTTGSANPLIIIDGVERPDLGRINPHDIENITVLKDASAAIYGARAANGVILVTTKRGQTGAPVFNFSHNQGFSQPTRHPKMANAFTFATIVNEIEMAAGGTARYSESDLQKFRTGTEVGYQTTNWYEEMTRKLTPQHQTTFSVTGGTESLDYYLSLGALGQEGHFNHGSTNLKRYNFRSNTNVKLNDYITFGLDLAGRLDDAHYPGNPDTRGVYSHIFLYHPDWTVYWPGTKFLRANRDGENLVNWVSDNGGIQDEKYKALESKLHVNLKLPWVEGLSITGSANYDAGYNFIKRFAMPRYTYDKIGNDYVRRIAGNSPSLATLNEEFNQFSVLTLNAQTNYDFSVGNHNFGFMAGYEQMEYDYNFFSAYRGDFPSPALPQFLAGSSNKDMYDNDGSASLTSRQNYFGRVTYDYQQKYLAQFIWRLDGSPNFPKEGRWGFFPGVTLGWRVSEEPFMQNMQFIDEFKIRGSYGKMGNDSIPNFQYLASYEFSNQDVAAKRYDYVIGNNDVLGVSQSGVPNPNITWEVAKMTNVGFEMSMGKGLLGVEFDLFKTERSNILTKRTAVIPDYTGLTLPDENVGIVENKGFELQLSHNKTINSRFRYSIGGNFSYARNKVIFADEAPAAEDYQMATGRPIGAELYYKAIGIFRDQEEIDAYPSLSGAVPGDLKYEDVNKDGSLDARDRIRINKSTTPEIVYGINANVAYSNFDFSVLFQGQENAMAYFGQYFPRLNPSTFGNFLEWRAEGRWTLDNPDNATQPRASSNGSSTSNEASTHWMFDAGFLRLKNVELGYSLPTNIANRIRLQNLRIYVSANNALILYDNMKDLGFDPETSDYWFYPQQRTFNAGINLTF